MSDQKIADLVHVTSQVSRDSRKDLARPAIVSVAYTGTVITAGAAPTEREAAAAALGVLEGVTESAREKMAAMGLQPPAPRLVVPDGHVVYSPECQAALARVSCALGTLNSAPDEILRRLVELGHALGDALGGDAAEVSLCDLDRRLHGVLALAGDPVSTVDKIWPRGRGSSSELGEAWAMLSGERACPGGAVGVLAELHVLSDAVARALSGQDVPELGPMLRRLLPVDHPVRLEGGTSAVRLVIEPPEPDDADASRFWHEQSRVQIERWGEEQRQTILHLRREVQASVEVSYDTDRALEKARGACRRLRERGEQFERLYSESASRVSAAIRDLLVVEGKVNVLSATNKALAAERDAANAEACKVREQLAAHVRRAEWLGLPADPDKLADIASDTVERGQLVVERTWSTQAADGQPRRVVVRTTGPLKGTRVVWDRLKHQSRVQHDVPEYPVASKVVGPGGAAGEVRRYDPSRWEPYEVLMAGACVWCRPDELRAAPAVVPPSFEAGDCVTRTDGDFVGRRMTVLSARVGETRARFEDTQSVVIYTAPNALRLAPELCPEQELRLGDRVVAAHEGATPRLGHVVEFGDSMVLVRCDGESSSCWYARHTLKRTGSRREVSGGQLGDVVAPSEVQR